MDSDNSNIDKVEADSSLDFIKEMLGEVKEVESDTTIANQQTKENIILGIDLGTTNSCVSIWRNNNLEIIPDENGNNTIPSYVAFTKTSRYVGQEAKNQKDLNPKNVFYEVKRLIGRKIDDTSVKNDLEFLTYDIDGMKDDENPEEDGNIIINGEYDNYTPEEISSIILTKLKQMAHNYLKREINDVVITVPAYFNDAQRQATKDAAIIAGLNCVRIINEPTAAALAYGLLDKSIYKKTQKEKKEMNILVYDLGGGTLDCSLLSIYDGIFEVKASVGNTHLGGADFDNRIMSYAISQFKRQNKYEKLGEVSSMSLQKLRKSCENTKKLLSVSLKTNIIVKDFYDNKDLIVQLTQNKLIEICRDLLILCMKPLEDVLESGEVNKEDIDEIILVGGMTRMPIIRNNVKTFFNKEPNCSLNPDEVVSTGAAIQAYILANKSDPFSENITLLDITPLSIGVEIIGGLMNTLIPRNTVLPVTKKRKYTTDSDYVEAVTIKIYEGERKMTKDNFLVGEFELEGLEKLPRGMHEIEIIFRIDINGIITVTAESLTKYEKEKEIIKKTITIAGNKGRLRPHQIKKLVEEAQQYELKDKIERQKKQLYYEIDEICSNININIQNNEFKLSEQNKVKIQEEINNSIKWLKEKKYNEREEGEYKELLEKLKKQFGTLILKYNKDNEKFKESGDTKTNIQSTTVYGNEEDEIDEIVLEKIEEEDMGITTMEEEEKKEIKELRRNLIEMCQSIFEIFNSTNINITKEEIKEMKESIDDTLLWVHIQTKPNKTEFKIKIDEINESCNKILEKYSNNIFKEEIKTGEEELEQLCLTIKTSIECNMIPIKDESKLKELSNIIDKEIEWICINRVDEIIQPEEEYKKRIESINEICKQLYESVIGINLGNIQNTNINIQNTANEEDEYEGTNIMDLIGNN